jgi:ribonuclease P protein component
VRAAPRAVIDSPSDAAVVAPGTRSKTSTRRQAIALGDAAAFDRCLARPALIRSGPFALHLFGQSSMSTDTSLADTAVPCWRLGLVIPKRYEASAVARNTIKRRWRDAFRRGRATWAEEFGSRCRRAHAGAADEESRGAAARESPCA